MLACKIYKIRGDKNAYMNEEYIKAKQEQEANKKEVEKLQQKLDNMENQKQQDKEYKKDYFIAVKKDLQNTFSNCFEREGLKVGYIHLRLKSTRDDIIKHVAENSDEIRWIDDNYEKELERIKKIYENDEKAKLEILKPKIEAEKAKQQQHEINMQYAETFFKIFLVLSPFILIIGLLIWGYFKFAVPVLG